MTTRDRDGGRRPVAMTVTEAWLLHDCLQPQFAGFGGRDPSAKPWHGESALRQLAAALLLAQDGRLSSEAPIAVAFTADELTVLSYHLPRTAGRTAQDLLLRLWRAREELELGIPLLAEEPATSEAETARHRLAEWRARQAEITKGGDGDGGGEGERDDDRDRGAGASGSGVAS